MVWEYVVINVVREHWGDSNGGHGRLHLHKLPGSNDWYDPTPVFNELGAQGWEAVTVAAPTSGAGMYLFKRTTD